MSEYIAQHRVIYGHGANGVLVRVEALEGQTLLADADESDVAGLLKLGAIKQIAAPKPIEPKTEKADRKPAAVVAPKE